MRGRFSRVPRHLFRVHHPGSGGVTNESYASSAEWEALAPEFTDVFAFREVAQAGQSLDNHLRWKQVPGKPSPFVSWTSSLLTAIAYIFYLYGKGESLDQIYLTVLDASRCHPDVFLDDLSLIEALQCTWPYTGLEDLWKLRTGLKGPVYYFGEFLSQGSLAIKGKSETVTAEQLIERGLFTLQPEFKKFLGWNLHGSAEESPKWANAVMDYRKFLAQESHKFRLGQVQLKAAQSIVSLFGANLGLRFPMMVHLIGLLPKPGLDELFELTIMTPALSDPYKNFRFLPEMNLFRAKGLIETDRVYGIVSQVDQNRELM
ncbi:unnamed protein product [Clonostachys rhizophaga]|uniref:DUF7587 domain-containing protein n=1 Tax=Clonostachys rhizophaga TaxID=160324 RepID=A0A9N9VN55_9HYPO|nr:unnamed protein product [Clonostachys rhizophaga]